jgi:peptide subunit release factor 1 (eRF1)
VIAAAALEVEEKVERAKQGALVDRLRDAVGGTGAVAGLDPVLKTLVERRVETLVVSDGYEAPGWRCDNCQLLAVKGRQCPLCGGAMISASDVIEEAIEEALTQSCKVSVVKDNADLDVLGRIGALLRF